MNDINKIKNTTKKYTSINIFTKNMSSKLFKLGILLLASAPAVIFAIYFQLCWNKK